MKMGIGHLRVRIHQSIGDPPLVFSLRTGGIFTGSLTNIVVGEADVWRIVCSALMHVTLSAVAFMGLASGIAAILIRMATQARLTIIVAGIWFMDVVAGAAGQALVFCARTLRESVTVTRNTEFCALGPSGYEDGHILVQRLSDIICIPALVSVEGARFPDQMTLLANLTLSPWRKS